MNIKNSLIKKINKKKQPLRLDKFISNLFYEKDSYYVSKNPLGTKGDFVTSPEISQMFGEILGAYILNYWIKNINSKFNLIELGPGNGTLLIDILRVSKLNSNFIKFCTLKFLEKSKYLKKIQKKRFSHSNIKKIKWLKEFKYYYKIPNIIYCNEFFDCLPIRQFYYNNCWYEKFVNYNKKDDVFYFVNKKVKQKKLINLLKNYNEYKVAEISFERRKIFKKLCKQIYNTKGILILIDYGYDNPINNFTLQSVYNHKKTHIFQNLGSQDVTSLVNFSELINIAKDLKLKILSYCTQREFLLSNGISERKNSLIKNQSKEKKEVIEKQYNRLVDKKEMGDNFKFLIVSS